MSYESLSAKIGERTFNEETKATFIRWAEQWSEERIAAGRARDVAAKTRKYGNTELTEEDQEPHSTPEDPKADEANLSFIRRLLKRLFG